MADLMSLVPSMLEHRDVLIEKNPLLVREVKRLEAELAYRFEQQCGTTEDLAASDSDASDSLPKEAVVSAPVVLSI